MTIAQKHALVTGASSGIGAAIVQALLDGGWRVTGVSRRPADVDHPHYSHLALDLSDIQSLAPRMQGLRVDAFVHAAGFMQTGLLGQLDDAALQAMWQVHVQAAEVMANQLIGTMPDGGRVVLIGSRAASGLPGRSQYGATKAALVAMARAWAAELAPRQITVNVVAPAATATPMLGDPGRAGVQPKLPPIGRYIDPQEVAATVQFLLSPMAGAITGQQLVMCGGSSL
jgi:NAD(P)-dependent dehydrogenase (short-subunit alcohol dehydrogenase family)